MIGGYTGSISRSKTIAKLDSTSFEWTKAGDLITERRGHNAIFDGKNFIVVGGYPSSNGAVNTEKCSISEGQVTCVEQDPTLIHYKFYPELFLVQEGTSGFLTC